MSLFHLGILPWSEPGSVTGASPINHPLAHAIHRPFSSVSHQLHLEGAEKSAALKCSPLALLSPAQPDRLTITVIQETSLTNRSRKQFVGTLLRGVLSNHIASLTNLFFCDNLGETGKDFTPSPNPDPLVHLDRPSDQPAGSN